MRRSGYILLAVSGVVLATAFGGLAELASPSSSNAEGDIRGGNSNSSSGPQLIPGNPLPGTMTVSGVAMPDATTSPRAVVTVGPDGRPVVTILPAPGSSAAPIVLPPGSPIPAGTYIPPGTQLPPGTPPPGTSTGGTTTTSGRSDPPSHTPSSKPSTTTPPTTTPDPTSTTADVPPTTSSSSGASAS
jgi:hypothetical protein